MVSLKQPKRLDAKAVEENMTTSIINSLGLGSGFDTAALVRDLAAASRAPKVQVFDARQQTSQAKISAVGQARSILDNFASSLSQVVAEGGLQTQPRVSDETALSAAAEPGARLGNFAADIEISQLARAQSIYSAGVAAPADPVGQGTLTLTVGARTASIVINSTNDSLTGLATAINASALGVKASVVNDQGTQRLVLKGETGAASAFTLTAEPGSAPELDRFTYAGPGSQMALAQAAQDASFTLDGVPYSRATNSFSDVVPGVTMTLKKAAPGTLIAIGSNRPTETLRTTVSDFVNVFNELKQGIAAARKAVGPDQSLRMLEQQLSTFIGRAVTSYSSFDSLSDIGISTNRDGTIALNSAKFEAALAADPDAVEAMFSPTRDATHDAVTDPGLAGAFKSLATTLTSDGGALAALTARLSKEAASLVADRAKMEAREARYAEQLERRFSGLDARMGALKATQSYLDQQVKLWTKSN